MKNHTMGRWIAVAATVMLTAGNFTGIAQAAGGTLPVAEIKKPEEPVTGYVLADSADRYLNEEDLKTLDAAELRIARNEIFARHGRQFYYEDLQNYFDMCEWYEGTVNPEDLNMPELSHLEAANVMLIARYESANAETENDTEVKEEKDYILEFSDNQYLNVSDLEGLTADELRLARNEIYARHGRRFNYEDLQEYFDGKSWYEGTVEPDEFDQEVFNDYEAANVLLIKDYEDSLKDAGETADSSKENPNVNVASGNLVRIAIPKYQAQGALYSAVMANDAEDLENGNPWQAGLALEALPVYRNGCYDLSGTGNLFGLSEEEMMEKLTEAAETLGLTIYSTRLGTNATKGMDGVLVPGDIVYRIQADTDNGRLTAEADGTILYNIPMGLQLPEEYTFTSKGNTEEAEAALDYLAERFAALLGYDSPETIVEGSYNRSGQYVHSYRVYDGSSDCAENILGYIFRYAEFSPDDGGNLMMIRIRDGLTKGEKLGDYPILSALEAQEKLLAGEYQTNVPVAVQESSVIAKAELVYRSGQTEEILLPYYRFYVEIPNAEELHLSGVDGMKAYGLYYVPAVQDEYILSQEGTLQYQ